jgi:hypothetical protein
VAFVFGGDAQGCAVEFDGSAASGASAGVSVYVGLDVGTPQASGAVGNIVGNATNSKQLKGDTLCAGGGAWIASVSVCGGLILNQETNEYEFNGIVTVFGGVGASLAPADVHISAGVTYAWQVWKDGKVDVRHGPGPSQPAHCVDFNEAMGAVGCG